MRLVCINNIGKERILTRNKEYDIKEVTKEGFCVIDDMGQDLWCDKSRFIESDFDRCMIIG